MLELWELTEKLILSQTVMKRSKKIALKLTFNYFKY